MGRIKDINKYKYDTNITGNESVIGSDFDEEGITKNYKLSNLAAYFSSYFASQNQSVSLTGDLKGGNGITVINTVAQPSLIRDKPITNVFSDEDSFLYLNNSGLSQIKWKTISDYIQENGGGYVPEPQTPLNLSGSGIQTIRNIVTNSAGQVVSASLSLIQDSTNLQKGIIRIADASEYNSNSTTVALPPAASSNFLSSDSILGDVPFLPKFVGTNKIGESVIQEDARKIGVGLLPVSERLEVAGKCYAYGYKTPSNSSEKVLTTDGNEAIGNEDVRVSNGNIELLPLNIRTTSSLTVPTTKYKLIYITIEGTNNSPIVLPTQGAEGQRIYIINDSTVGTTITINSTLVEIDPKMIWIFYYNGVKWFGYKTDQIL